MPDARKPTHPLTVALAALVLAGALYVGGRPVRTAPALGPLLDPLNGIWSLARTATPPATAEVRIPGVTGRVDVRFDDRGVPHIFATSTADAVRALGYVHARDRLFQMEIQTRAVAGTLSEIAGARTLDLDRTARGQGLADAATRGFDRLPAVSPAKVLATAYAEGVNAWIDGMGGADLPFEMRLLGSRPQRWEPKYTAYLFARMGLTLAYSDGELRRAAVEALVGSAATDALFPRNNPIVEPIQPNGQRAPRHDWVMIPPAGTGDSTKARIAMADLDAARTARIAFGGHLSDQPGDHLTNHLDDHLDDVAVGSNNWVVAPRRTAAGKALLAGDPHLSMTLPSIWYEAHLVVADSLDVYGVTLLGSPLPPIGFNRDVAWTETNTGADVADYFVETVDNAGRPTRYQLDGTWKPLRERVEVIHGRNGTTLATDTVLETHRGPMLKSGGQWVSRRWTVTDGDDIVAPFLGIARARSVREIWSALEGFTMPAQNFASADRAGHIAIRSAANYPVRSKSADRGDKVLDGSKSSSDWAGWLKFPEQPNTYDPPQGFAVSANQQPKDPRVDPRYLGWDWPSPWRAMRINEVLRGDSAMTPDKMRRLQTDPVSAQTPYFLPIFIAAGEAAGARDTVLAQATALLKDWDGRLDPENRAAVVFEAAIAELSQRTWDELAAPPRGNERPRIVETPQAVILAGLLRDADSPWWDDRTTPNVRERRDDIVRASLGAAWARVVARFGPPGDAWRWGNARRASVRHQLFGVAPLSHLSVPLVGGPGSVSPSSGSGNHGASWRMVVELGEEVRGWGTYPGGQSGNPISPRYADFLGKWSAGTLDTLRFPRRPDDLVPGLTSSRLTIMGTP
jgi:penicillin amidase